MGRGGPAQGPARPPTSGAFSAGRWTCPGHFPRWSSALTAASHRAGAAAKREVCEWTGSRVSPAAAVRPAPPPPAAPSRRRPSAGVGRGPSFPASAKPISTRAPGAREAAAEGRAGGGEGVPADSPTARATCGDGAGPADSGRGGPAPWGAPQVGSRAGAPALQRAPCRRRDRKASAAIWWRRGGSCGAAWGGPARARGRARRSLALRLSEPRRTAAKPHASAPWRCSGFPKRSGVRRGPCSAGVGAWALVPGSPHPSWLMSSRALRPLNPTFSFVKEASEARDLRSFCKDCLGRRLESPRPTVRA